MTSVAEGGAGLRRDAGVIGLLYFSLGGIIGSGWLFGALNAAQLAGPYSVFSWLIGAAAVGLLALVYAELATMFPRSGALIHISHIGHGSLVGKIWSWTLFLSSVTTPPIEVMAILTYAGNYVPGLVHPQSGVLTTPGFFAAVALLGVVIIINLCAIRLVLWINSATTWWKLAVPTATIVILMLLSFHPHNLSLKLGTVHPAGMLSAVSTAGIIFSFLGFRLAINLGGETSNPSKFIPIAVIGSVVIATLIYVGLQLAFLFALKPSDLAGGWHNLHFPGIAGPLAALAATAGAIWWATILYIDAIISPLGTALIYSTNTSRLGMGMAQMGSAPEKLERLSKNGVPWVALLATYVVGAIFFFPFPSWQKLVGYVSSVTVLSYGIGPIVLLILRRAKPDAERPFRLRGAWIVSAVAFIVSNWIVFWTGFATVNFLFALLAGLLVIYLLWHFLVKKLAWSDLGWSHTWWVIPYFGGLWYLSSLGPNALGGNATLALGWDMLIIAVFSLIILILAVSCALPKEQIETYIRQGEEMEAPPEA